MSACGEGGTILCQKTFEATMEKNINMIELKQAEKRLEAVLLRFFSF